MLKTIGLVFFFALGFAITGGAMFVAFAAITPCAYEDSPNCYWSAREQGNGEGASFLDLGGHAIYWR